MKLLLGQNILVLLSVIILYYLFNTDTFIPYTETNSINWENVIVLIFFSSVILTNLVSIIFTLISKYLFKKDYSKELFYRSMKIGFLLNFGIISVFVLNFLHILNIYYGLAILGVAIITLIII
jgi:hypothetical protein